MTDLFLTAADTASGTEVSSGMAACSDSSLALIFVVFYFLLIRPRGKRKKKFQRCVPPLRLATKSLPQAVLSAALSA